MRQEIIDLIYKTRAIAIVRGVPEARVRLLAEALYAGGIRLMEVTYNHESEDALKETDRAIEALCRAVPGDMIIGAGTVLSLACLRRAAGAGARFIISPDANPAVISETRRMELVSIPGAFTPTEIALAHGAGADFVKLFPAGNLGPGYVKAVRAPLHHIPLLAVGGINAANAACFLAAGAAGVGVGGSLTNREWLENGDTEKLAREARALMNAVNA